MQGNLPLAALFTCTDGAAIADNVRADALGSHGKQEVEGLFPGAMFFTCTDGLASGACNNVTVQRVANVQTCPKPSAGSQNSVVWVATLLQDSLRFTTAIDQKEAALKRWWREVPCGINPTSEPSPHILLRKLGAKFYVQACPGQGALL